MASGKTTPNVVASKIPTQGSKMGAAYYAARTSSNYNSANTSVVKDVKNIASTSARENVAKIQSALARNNDMGSQVLAGTIATGVMANRGMKLAQAASPIVIDAAKNLPTNVGKVATGVVNVGKGAWDVTSTAGRATVTLARTAQIMSSGFVPFNAQFTKNVLLNQAKITGLLHTTTSQRVINGVSQIYSRMNQIRTSVVQTAKGIKTGVVTTTNAVKRSYTLVRGMVNGSVKTSVVAHKTLMKAGELAKSAGLKGLKATGQVGKVVAHGTVKGGEWALKNGFSMTHKSLTAGYKAVEKAFSSTDDMMLQGLGKTARIARYSIKTSVVAGRVSGRTVKTSVKGTVGAAKGTYRAINFIRQKGLRAAYARARNKTAAAVAKAGKSVVTLALNIVRALGTKVIVPLILIVATVAIVMSLISAPVAAVGGIFGSIFDLFNFGSNSHEEMDIRTYITDSADGIPALKRDYINDLYNYIQGQLEANGGGYDYVRFKTNTRDDIIEPTIEGITGVFYTDDELANIIQPIFNAVILKDYELEVTESEAKQVLTDIFNKLFKRSSTGTIEYCGQSITDGSGTPSTHSCGHIHSLSDCPNPITGTHSSFECISCCRKRCPGHKVPYVNPDGSVTERTYYCSGCEHICDGYSYCGGHDVLTVMLNIDGIYQLLYEYFEQPIDQLSSKANRSEEEERELSNLKDTYEICLEYISQVQQQFGGGLTMQDLSGVEWVSGSRVGNQEIIDLALSQVGQVGGQPYWSWYGFTSRVEWCATFVSWCMNRVGHSEVRYASCQYGGVPYFKNAGRWANGGFTDLVAGDVIFFDWDGNGTADHTGLVIGTDGEYVYTVEGNSGDTCRTKQYRLNSSVIMGYGLMNY